jgi:hypothetical protein
MLAYYWVLAIPAMAGVFGLYLYISLCFCHVHFDEAFSSLRIPDFKGFSRWAGWKSKQGGGGGPGASACKLLPWAPGQRLYPAPRPDPTQPYPHPDLTTTTTTRPCRMHITQEGDLEVYSLGVAEVPRKWKEDPRWHTLQAGGGACGPCCCSCRPCLPPPPCRCCRQPRPQLAQPRSPPQPTPHPLLVQGGGARRDASWRALYPSRWAPDFSSSRGGGGGGRGARAKQQDVTYELIDYVRIPQRRPL